ncbi:MAG: hypothetical protein IKR57_05270 [Bacilli bacterium]|nr:hypothetical protein [Bacilli bacterium]
MDGISFLRKIRQDYIQYNVEWPINLSSSIYNYSINGIPDNECMMIYKGWAPTIEISSKEEFERFIDINYKQDPKAYFKDGILFTTSDIDKISRVVKTTLDYYMDKDYEAAIDGFIVALKPIVPRLEKSNIIDNN